MNRIKKDLQNLTLKEGISYSMAVVLFVFGIIMSIWGFVTPPEGELSNSLLFLVGQSLLFIAAILGISYSYEEKLNHFQAEIRRQMNNKDDGQEEYSDNDM